MSRALAIAVFVVAWTGYASGHEDAVQRSFAGDTVHLNLSVGDYRLTASTDRRIRVTPRTKTDQMSTRIDVNLLGT